MTQSRKTALILGGARSGKSAFAVRLATRLGQPVLFVATAVAQDEEMSARIAKHRAERPETWRTVEAPLAVGPAIRVWGEPVRTIVVDCLTLLVSNLLLRATEHLSETELRELTEASAMPTVEAEVGELLDAANASGAHLVVVSGEVGMGLVPPYPLGRVFRDLLGRGNQILASQADMVYLMVAGIPVDVRRLGVNEEDILTT